MQIQIPLIKKKFYLVCTIIFFIWMFFIDPNNLRSQYKSYKGVKEEEKKVQFYKDNIKDLTLKSKNISEDTELERYAREKFYMKKKNEDVFVMPMER
jgi:cell division protein DivIC